MKTLKFNYLLKKELISTAIFVVLTIFSVLFFDKSLAIFIHHHGIDEWAHNYGLRHLVNGLPIILPIYYLVLISFKKPSIDLGYRFLYVLYLYGLINFTIACKQALKIVFGRYWPQTWIHNNLSLIHDGVYGFNWFHGINSAFPSGHSTFVAIIAISLSLIYPRMRIWLYAMISIMVISLVLLNYHYLGDCFAGIALANLFAILGLVFYRYSYFKIRNLFIKIV